MPGVTRPAPRRRPSPSTSAITLQPRGALLTAFRISLACRWNIPAASSMLITAATSLPGQSKLNAVDCQPGLGL